MEAKAAAKEQAAREDKYERLLMDVYNALYKVRAEAAFAHLLQRCPDSLSLCRILSSVQPDTTTSQAESQAFTWKL